MSDRALWPAEVAAAATNGRTGADWRASGVSIDSRSVGPGDLFVAIEGPNFDGHVFVAEALAKGAAAAMVARRPDGLEPGAPLLEVADTLAGLEALGRAARQRCDARIVAVTGSVGKTGTKEALRMALARDGATHASEGNLNNHWGAPLSLARMPADSRYGVFELGMSDAGEIEPLSRMVRPHVAIITNVEPVHLEFFASVAAIADAKAEIFLGLEPGGIAILNHDNQHYTRLRQMAEAVGAARIISFGSHEAAAARLIGLAEHPTCNCISADIDGQAVTYKVGAPGRHWAINSLAVLAAVRAVGGDLGLAALAMAEIAPAKGRGRRHLVELPDGILQLIDESYNASPIATRAAIEMLGASQPGPGGRRIAVLGDMLELGDAAPDLHAGLAEHLQAARVDQVFVCGANMKHLRAALPRHMRAAREEGAEELLPRVLAAVRPGDVVLVKGSLGMAMAPIVEALRHLGGNAAAAANG
ncbi:MAG: UDP-N-acetylmuramoylalanyl-D-glutamyl-2,6-diaminopimelate--D-alanyl-D-alanine ligase [Alphaproteobacteria bacterium]|jgi:UDP-N-acetylmuramoyl-tripeptide--D-alanyl-D-alanine ligase|nr:UDP-N-acetylmuramoylalanyl-D-glutamyl-2,6-diaminopimelate--D-alanyl-D-alanine ligase [Alphaproteobacteria bacterium]MDP6812506.1 UDP-N-acetylmuramoylalanyl-D-glutamyl-2,6-diaminopimelate--D-alanyl-D-alanine ligase [Alphaproteobacteria bacterium]